MSDFAIFTNEKHIRLTPQKRIEHKRLNISAGGAIISIGQGASISMGQGAFISLGGKRIMGGQRIDIDSERVYGDPDIKMKKEIIVAFKLGETDIDSYLFCSHIIKEGEKIVSDFLNLF